MAKAKPRGRPPGETMQVYAVRLPAARARELEEIAKRETTPPATVLRRLVIERLDQLKREHGAGQ